MYKKLNNIKYKHQILLILILSFALVLRLIFFTGIGYSDSLSYTSYANNFAEGKPVLTHHRALRLGIVFPVAVLYSIFGVNEFSSNILPLFLSLGSIVLTYAISKLLFNEKIGLLSAFLLSFFPMDVIYSTRLMPDLPAAFFVALSVYLFLKSEKTYKETSSSILCLFSGISLGISYLMKEISLLIALFFGAYILYNRKIRKRYFLIVLGFALIFFMEYFYFLRLTGIPFFRFQTISFTETGVVLQTNNYGRGDLPLSLLHYPYIIFTDRLLGLFFPFIFMAVFYSLLYKKRETYSILFWFVPLLLYISFGSTSFTKYVPLSVTSRMLFIITIPGIVLLSFFLSQNDRLIKKVLMPVIVVILFTSSLGYTYTLDDRTDIASEKIAYAYLKSLPEIPIYTDDRTAATLGYLSGYKAQDNTKVFHYYGGLYKPEEAYALDLSKVNNSYIVINWKIIDFLSYSAHTKGIKYPQQIFDTPKNWVLKKSIGLKGKDMIEIYYAP